jgi:hypothetical protein
LAKNFWGIKNYHLSIPRPPEKDVEDTEEAFSPQKRTTSTSKHEISVFIFAHLDPDPDSGSGYGSTDLIESGSNPDPYPPGVVDLE